ncbi:MAG: DUF1559 domain-containing protein [Armatimonadetes bacterium]|nr:DUF1559 domain-containing protein [Armatimonadota bacterium]PIU63114.1 MAG: hypothetical protein COS85_16735 [Armatimonadetes bacterium CG07_land_8_20_14_0_80_59_28]PIX40346.1 MAG: hypothetical protein COZ56_14945 [Armatimonadetes bacterium CG_4_8_14_3_um_filter_58_9]PIY43656.1 MAG: hypothetical protein COZ05_10445 [Armatimonadetes bacterium CG_4_10_14_3_um_filter_59_10]PJB71610.1 MAG: hypothetical protein CO095_07915 [Armatimonadetes bacterium CG_4_9_14_3_um_filter_58_7]
MSNLRSVETICRNANAMYKHGKPLTIILSWGLVVILLWCSGHRARENARSASCQSNLKSLGIALAMYAEDNGGRYPKGETLDDLLGMAPGQFEDCFSSDDCDTTIALFPYVKSVNILLCPSGFGAEYRYHPVASSYEWNGALSQWPRDRLEFVANIPALFDSRARHNVGRNVCFADGHVTWLRESDWKRAMEVKPDLVSRLPKSSNRKP